MNTFQGKNQYIAFLVGLGIIFSFWAIISIPYAGRSYIPTHDGEFHILRFYEFTKMLQDGHLFPRWSPGLNSGYGLPLFIFHYPFPNYVGSVIHLLGFSLIDSYKLSLVIGYLIALISCYILMLKFTKLFIAVGATLVFATVPYWFVDIAVRGSIGEIWGIAWCMLALASVSWNKKIVLGLSIFLLCITHNIMAMITLPIIAVYIFLTNKTVLIQYILGFLGAAYFWLPALFESKYMVGLNTSTYSDHFPQLFQLLIPSWGSGFSTPGASGTEMSQQIGIIPLLIFFITIITFIKINKHPLYINLVRFFLVVIIIVFFLLLEISIPLWTILKPLQLVQYPWRLLSLIVISIPFLAVYSFEYMRKWMILVIVLASIVLTFAYSQPVLYEPRSDEYYTSEKNYTDGTSSMGNSFSTKWTTWKKERPTSRISILSGDGVVTSLSSTTTTDRFTIQGEKESTVLINRLYYPGWYVYSDNKSIPINNNDGIIEVTIPPGAHTITAVFKDTPLRMISNIISIIAMSFLLLSVLIRPKRFTLGSRKL